MRSITKNRKQRSTYLPISIKFLVKAILIVLGCTVWGTGFIWAVLASYILLPVVKGILTFFVGLGAIIASIYILFSFL